MLHRHVLPYDLYFADPPGAQPYAGRLPVRTWDPAASHDDKVKVMRALTTATPLSKKLERARHNIAVPMPRFYSVRVTAANAVDPESERAAVARLDLEDIFGECARVYQVVSHQNFIVDDENLQAKIESTARALDAVLADYERSATWRAPVINELTVACYNAKIKENNT